MHCRYVCGNNELETELTGSPNTLQQLRCPYYTCTRRWLINFYMWAGYNQLLLKLLTPVSSATESYYPTVAH